jgi:hypothetical protein
MKLVSLKCWTVWAVERVGKAVVEVVEENRMVVAVG